MRRKMFKKLVAFLLVMVFVTNIQCANANASEKKDDGLTAYVESILPQYLKVNELYADEYKVSEPIALYNWATGVSEKTFFLVFEGDNVVGQMVVQCYEGEYYSSFNTSYVDVLTKVYREKTPVEFGSYNECFVMRTENENVLLSVTNKVNPLKGLSDNVQRGISNLNCLKPITIDRAMKVSPAVSPRTNVYNIQLDVDSVANPPIGNGICWASCVASKVRFQKGININARDVYESLIEEYNGTPVGDCSWVTRAYSLYNLDVVLLINALTARDCYSKLNSGKPIQMDLVRSDGDSAHSVLLAGVYYTDLGNAAGGVYKIMDPNVFGLVSVSVSSSVIRNGSGFVYVANQGDGHTYSKWIRSFY